MKRYLLVPFHGTPLLLVVTFSLGLALASQAGFMGIPLGFILRRLKGRHKTVGFIYFLAPVAALYLIFMPLGGMGFFGLNGGPGIMVHAFIANAPYGIVTTLAVAALCGRGGPGVSSARPPGSA